MRVWGLIRMYPPAPIRSNALHPVLEGEISTSQHRAMDHRASERDFDSWLLLCVHADKGMAKYTLRQCTYVFDIFMIFVIRWYLVRENRTRDAEKLASGEEYDEFGYVEHTQEDGSIIRLKVPIQFMDITDKENRAFRYPL